MQRTSLHINKPIEYKMEIFKLLKIQSQKYIELTKLYFLAAEHYNFLIDH